MKADDYLKLKPEKKYNDIIMTSTNNQESASYRIQIINIKNPVQRKILVRFYLPFFYLELHSHLHKVNQIITITF